MAELRFVSAVVDDLEALDTPVVIAALKKLRLLRDNPDAGDPLHSPLTGFRKLVFGRNDWRIIYRPEGDDVCIIWVIGPRSDDECYDEAERRIKELDSTPEVLALTALLEALQGAVGRVVRKRSADD